MIEWSVFVFNMLLIRFLSKRAPIIQFRHGKGTTTTKSTSVVDGTINLQQKNVNKKTSKRLKTTTSEYVYYRKPISEEEILTINSGGAWLYEKTTTK